MNLPKLSNEKIGCYHSKSTALQIERRVEPGDMKAILDQISQLEAIQAELGTISRQIKESIRMISRSN
jgi:hypothetical protein